MTFFAIDCTGAFTVQSGMSPTPNRMVVTLSSTVAEEIARLSQQMGGVKAPEVVRRGLALLDLMLTANASDNEELVIRIKDTGEIVRLHFGWETGR